jgi:hypothetical protein
VCVFLIYAKRQRDLGEELLSVAPDLHGSLAAYVLCRLYRLSARFRAVLVIIVKLVQETKSINKVGVWHNSHLVYGARHGHAAAGLPRRACAHPRSISPSAWISCMACVPKRQVAKSVTLGERKNISSLIRFRNSARSQGSCRCEGAALYTLGARAPPPGKSISPELRVFFGRPVKFPWPTWSAAGL